MKPKKRGSDKLKKNKKDLKKNYMKKDLLQFKII